MWQEIIVGVIVLIAFVALIRRLWPGANKGSSCGGCGTYESTPKSGKSRS